MQTCAAVGCQVKTDYFMCGAHWHLVPARLRRDLRQEFNDDNRREAIRAVAIKEHKTKLYETWSQTFDVDKLSPEEQTMAAPRRPKKIA
jgi:hypothetical protein